MWYSSIITALMCLMMLTMANSFKNALENIEQNAFNAEIARVEMEKMAENAEGRINTLSQIVVSLCNQQRDLIGCDRAQYLEEGGADE